MLRANEQDLDTHIPSLSLLQIWKIKKLVKSLNNARGAGTSMISLVIPPKSQVSQFSNMLTQEYGTASNIKSRVNRLSVLAAITSTQQRLKLYNRSEWAQSGGRAWERMLLT